MAHSLALLSKCDHKIQAAPTLVERTGPPESPPAYPRLFPATSPGGLCAPFARPAFRHLTVGRPQRKTLGLRELGGPEYAYFWQISDDPCPQI